MKNIRFKILAVILISVVLLFGAIFIILNTMLPTHFENEAKNALIYEKEYINKLMSDGDTQNTMDDYIGTYFSGNIFFIDLNYDAGFSEALFKNTNNYQLSMQIADREIRDYREIHNIEQGNCYTYKTENGYYVFMEYEDFFSMDGASPTIMYINIKPILKYINTLNWIFLAVFVCVAFIMSEIGLKLGAKIENVQETQRKFFQNSSHELKTPLMAIQGYAEGIETGVMDAKSSAEVIMQETDRMTKLVEELLSISKIDAHQLILNFAAIDIRELLYDCVRSAEPMQRRKNVQITPYFTDRSAFVSCDEDQLSKAFMNIIVNGLRHCRNSIVISCTINGEEAVIKFMDDGSGVSEEDIEHIFDRFYSSRDGNTGIGLALAKEIILLHRGSISAYNNDVGAVFEIRLPTV